MSSHGDQAARARTREILHAALERPPDERRAYVEARLTTGDTLEDALGLLEEVEQLGDFLEQPAGFGAARAFEPALPERIGRYRVERVLGWGGMGVVYLAVQDAPARRVAIKVLRFDASSATMARRFEREGQVLAGLSHPGIATIYEAGLAKLGAGSQPFLAMEFIDGETLTRYADLQQLDRRARVELVRQIAVAVAHAHAEGVLHRDLKPDNILVRADGSPCVLDFGVAQTASVDQEQGVGVTMTATGQVIGTLAYMPPEQARGARLDERADQFALGAILFELLTGELPFDVRGRLPHEALRIVADGDCWPPTHHDATLAGDLEAILLTALAAEPVRRYSSVTALAEDLERWLAGEPVRARAPSALELLLRCVQRHRGLSAAVILVLATLGAGLAWGAGTLLDLRREGEVSVLFSDLRLMEELELEAAGLWPTSSRTLPQLDSWLDRARDLLARGDGHRATLARLERGSAAVTATESVLGSEWLHDRARDFVRSTAAFEHGLLSEMAARRAVAASIFSETVGERSVQWSRAAIRVRNDPRLGALVLVPQEGLVPLGPDPASGLEEFALWSSGAVPVRIAGESIAPRPEHAIVLVLIPGGEVLIGAQSRDPEGVNFDPAVLAHEGQPFALRLDPFLVSKYELTQAQWSRSFGFNPSDWEVGSNIEGQVITSLHPAESMSWERALELLPRLGLTLPTEAQWEVAARAGSPWACLTGPDWTALIGQVSWKTDSAALRSREPKLEDDSFYTHMPVGSLTPNAFGLHDVIGNVWEFCLDTYKVAYHDLEHRPGDGLVLTPPDGDVSRRGQGSMTVPSGARVYIRQMKRFDGRDALTGVRPARALVREQIRDPRLTWRGPHD